jgi:hypothetical protein
MILMTRADWTDHGPAKPLTPIDPDVLVGVALHHPGDPHPLAALTAPKVAARLEAYRIQHVNGRGWSDIAYSVAFDAAGRVWPLRGLRHRSAANGDAQVNQSHLAFLLLTGDDEAPSPAMVAAVAQYRAEHLLALYPRARAVVGHRDIRPTPTACPGDLTQTLITHGAFLHTAYVLRRRLHQGLNGPDVAEWQKVVGTKADGDFGPLTAAATRRWQRHHGLDGNGTVGPVTAKAAGWELQP